MQQRGLSYKKKELQSLKDEIAQCPRYQQCPQCQKLFHYRIQNHLKTVFSRKNADADIVLIGKAPGIEEAKSDEGEPFYGQSGKLLKAIIAQSDLRNEKVYFCNVLCCHPPKNRLPYVGEVRNCRPFFNRTLEIMKPKVICCLGEVAAKSLLGAEYTTIDDMRGDVFYDERGIPVICTHHPATRRVKMEKRVKDMVDDFRLLMEVMNR